MRKLLTFSLWLLVTLSHAQTKTADSLLLALNNLSDESQRAATLNHLAVALRSVDFTKSRQYAIQAKAIAEKTDDKVQLGKSYLAIGTSYYMEGNHDQAMTNYLQALRTFEETSDKRGEIEALNEIATLEKKNNDLPNAATHLSDALKLSREIGDSVLIAHSMNNMGHLLELRGDLNGAMDYYRTSALIKEKLGRLYDASFNYDNIANVLSQQGKFDEAKKYYEKEIKTFSELNDRANYAVAINNLGEMYKLKKDYDHAAAFFLQALAISNEIHYRDLSSHIYRMLSQTYEAKKDFRKAYEYVLLGNALKDSVYNEQRSRQLVDMQTKYETDKKESQIKLLQQENQLKDYGLRQDRLFILGLLMVVFGLVIVGALWKNRTELKQRAALEATRAVLRENQLQAVISSQEAERKRFAADLHDGLGQIISALRLSLSKENPEKSTVDHALHLLNQMNVEIRNVAFNLMPQALIKEGLGEALKELATRINHAGGVTINVTAFSVSDQISSEQKIAIYRICQEWINNAVKYSGCTTISVQLVHHPDELVLTIEDDGNGFDKTILTRGEGNGWKNINSRLALVRGSIDIDSHPNRKGTTCVIAIPLYRALLANP